MQPGFRDIISTLGLSTGDTLLFRRQQPTSSPASGIPTITVSGRLKSASSDTEDEDEEEEEEAFIVNLVSAHQQEEMKATPLLSVGRSCALCPWPQKHCFHARKICWKLAWLLLPTVLPEFMHAALKLP